MRTRSVRRETRRRQCFVLPEMLLWRDHNFEHCPQSVTKVTNILRYKYHATQQSTHIFFEIVSSLDHVTAIFELMITPEQNLLETRWQFSSLTQNFDILTWQGQTMIGIGSNTEDTTNPLKSCLQMYAKSIFSKTTIAPFLECSSCNIVCIIHHNSCHLYEFGNLNKSIFA